MVEVFDPSRARTSRRLVTFRFEATRAADLIVAAHNGFTDGYDAGRRDASRGDRFDPVRDRRYREGDHDYNSRDGSRPEYKREYREAFQRGYERGYREVRR